MIDIASCGGNNVEFRLLDFTNKFVDGIGIYGNFLHYALVISLVGSAFFIFLFLWKKKRLDMDEEPKFQMMQEEDISQGEHVCHTKEKIK